MPEHYSKEERADYSKYVRTTLASRQAHHRFGESTVEFIRQLADAVEKAENENAAQGSTVELHFRQLKAECDRVMHGSGDMPRADALRRVSRNGGVPLRSLGAITAFYLGLAVTWWLAERLLVGWLLLCAFRAIASIVLVDTLIFGPLTWRSDFRHRSSRGMAHCESSVHRPDTAPKLCPASASHNALDNSAKLCPAASLHNDYKQDLKSQPPVDDEYHLPTKEHVMARQGTTKGLINQHTLGVLCSRQALVLPKNWDHVYLCFPDYLWARIFLAWPLTVHLLLGEPNSPGMILWLTRRWLGYHPPPSDPARLFANLFMETTCAIFCEPEITEEPDGSALCRFSVPNAASVCPDGQVQLGTLAGVIDCRNRIGLSCTFCDKDIDLADGVLLLSLVLAAQVHPQVHAYANWGTNVDATHPWVRRMSVCTVMYNHLGSSGFAGLCGLLHSLGVFEVTTKEVAQAVLQHVESFHIFEVPHYLSSPWPLVGLTLQVLGRTHLQSVPTHKHIYALQKYSNYVDFIIKIRSFFLSEFAKHQADFPGIDGESLFLGTVVHSTDHGNATHFCKPWDLVGKTAAYKANEEIAGLVSSTFTDRLPLITLACDMRFKHAKHPLFLKTYVAAARIDRRLADEMECAIVR